MFCSKCGARLADGTKKCDKCGAPVRVRSAAESKKEKDAAFDYAPRDLRKSQKQEETGNLPPVEDGPGGPAREKISYGAVTPLEKVTRRITRARHNLEERLEEDRMRRHIERAAKHYEALGAEPTPILKAYKPPKKAESGKSGSAANVAKKAAASAAAGRAAEAAIEEQIAREREKKVRANQEARELTARRAAEAKASVEREAVRRAAEAKASAERETERETARIEQEAAGRAAEEKAHAEQEAARRSAEEKARAEQEAAGRAAEAKVSEERETARVEQEAARRAAEEKARAEQEAARRAAEEKARVEQEAAGRAAEEKARAEQKAARIAAEEKARAEQEAAAARKAAEDKARQEREEAERLAAQALIARKEREARARQSRELSHRVLSEEEKQVQEARRIRRYYEEEPDGIDLFLGKFGLTKEAGVKLATLFLVAILSIIYVMGRGKAPAESGSPQAGEGMTGTQFSVSPESESTDGDNPFDNSDLPTGGGDFEHSQSDTDARQEGPDTQEPTGGEEP